MILHIDDLPYYMSVLENNVVIWLYDFALKLWVQGLTYWVIYVIENSDLKWLIIIITLRSVLLNIV